MVTVYYECGVHTVCVSHTCVSMCVCVSMCECVSMCVLSVLTHTLTVCVTSHTHTEQLPLHSVMAVSDTDTHTVPHTYCQ